MDSSLLSLAGKSLIAAGAGGVALIFAEGFPKLIRKSVDKAVRAALHADNEAARVEAIRLTAITSDFVSGMCAAVVLYVAVMVEIWKLIEFWYLVPGVILLGMGLAILWLGPKVLSASWIDHSEPQYDQGVGRMVRYTTRGLFAALMLATAVGLRVEQKHLEHQMAAEHQPKANPRLSEDAAPQKVPSRAP